MISLVFCFIFQTTSLVLALTAKAFMCGCFTLMVFNFSVFTYMNVCVNTIVCVCVCVYACVGGGAHALYVGPTEKCTILLCLNAARKLSLNLFLCACVCSHVWCVCVCYLCILWYEY